MRLPRRVVAGMRVFAAILLVGLAGPVAQAAPADAAQADVAPASAVPANAASAGPAPAGTGECTTPSIDRLQQWLASGEGTTVPASGSLLVPEGGRYAAKVVFQKEEWHVVVVWLGNQFDAQADLTGSSGFWLTYRADEDFYVQLRPASHWSGGDKWLTPIPSTGGKLVRKFFSFDPKAWTSLPELGTPPYPFGSALREARGLVFVGKTPNSLEFRGLRIDGYQPPCR